jgi:hypothetical protein
MLNTVLFGGPFTTPPFLVLALFALVLVLVLGRVLLALAWRVVAIALGIVLALWILGAVGIDVGAAVTAL